MRNTLAAACVVLCWVIGPPAAVPARAAEENRIAVHEPKLTVVNVSSHCDWCWGHTRLWHEERYAESIRQVLLLMRGHPHYVWLLETENEELRPFLERAGRQWPELIGEFWQRVREGRIEVIVGLSNPRLSEVYPETLVRNLVLAKEYFRGQAPGVVQNVYNAVDLMCGPSQMPQILAQAEYRYFMFSRPVGPQVVFWRKGLDGTRILSAKCFYGYNAMGRYGQPVKGFLPAPIWREALGGDDALPDPRLPQLAAGWDPHRKLLATNSRYFEEVRSCGAPLTELEGPLDSLECYVEAGLHGDRSLYMQNNQDEDRLLCLEQAQVMAISAGAPLAPAPADSLWHDVLSCTGHAIQWAWTGDYGERLAFARHRRARIEQSLHEALAAVAGKVLYRANLGAPLVVFNFHAWPVTGPVEFVLEGEPAGLVLRDGQGHRLPIQFTVEAQSGERQVAFVARSVPACGYKTFYLAREQTAATPAPSLNSGMGPVENEQFRARMRADGALEVFDKLRQLPLGSPEAGGLGEVVYYDAPQIRDWQMNGPLGPRHAWKIKPGQLEFVQGPVFASLRATGTFGPHSATRELRLWQGSRRLDYHLELDAADGCGVFAIRFPLGLAGRVFAGIPFGAEPRENFDREPFRGEYFVQGYPAGYYATRWTDVSSATLGYTFVCPAGAHTGYAFLPDQRALEFLLLRLRPSTPGMWGQMHPSIKGTGRHVFDCALVPHALTWREAASYRDALQSHVPLLAFSPDLGLRRARPGKGPSNQGHAPRDQASFVELSPANVVLSALRLAAASPLKGPPEVELRLYETIGRPADVVIRLARPVRGVQETNFLGRPVSELGRIEVRSDGIHLRLPPWKIANLRLHLE